MKEFSVLLLLNLYLTKFITIISYSLIIELLWIFWLFPLISISFLFYTFSYRCFVGVFTPLYVYRNSLHLSHTCSNSSLHVGNSHLIHSLHPGKSRRTLITVELIKTLILINVERLLCSLTFWSEGPFSPLREHVLRHHSSTGYFLAFSVHYSGG